MDRERIGDHQRLVSELRNAGVRAELYLGTSGMKAQMKYADRRGSPCVVIQGEEERARGEVEIKDLVQGAQMAGTSPPARSGATPGRRKFRCPRRRW
jgi:histidyl-tRNA synthetase